MVRVVANKYKKPTCKGKCFMQMRLKSFLLLKNEDLTSGNQISPKQNKNLFYYTRNVFKDLPTLAAQTHETEAMQTITDL